MADAIELTGLWKSDKPTKTGDVYYSGKVRQEVVIPAGSLVCLFKNKPKEGYAELPPNAPAMTIRVLPPRDYEPAERHYQPPADDEVPF